MFLELAFRVIDDAARRNLSLELYGTWKNFLLEATVGVGAIFLFAVTELAFYLFNFFLVGDIQVQYFPSHSNFIPEIVFLFHFNASAT